MKIIKDAVKPKADIFNLRLTKLEREKIRIKAEEYFGGNVSGYMKYAAINYVPRKDELIEVKYAKK